VVHRDRRRVEREVCFRLEVRATLAYLFQREEVAEITLLIVRVVKRTLELMRLAGAPLVHEHEVAVLAYFGERSHDAGRIFRRSRSWSAGEVEERIGFALLTDRGQHEN